MKYLLLLLLLIPHFGFAQKVSKGNMWHLIVLDSLTEKGIPGVTIVTGVNKKFISDSNGGVGVGKELIGLTNTIKLSSIGYQSKILFYPINSVYPDTINLIPSNTLLTEVVVSSGKQPIKIGNIKKKHNGHLPGNPSEIMAQYIPNDKKIVGIITSIEYDINDTRHGIERPFKVGLYTKSKNNIFPDEDLLKDSIIVANPERKTHIVVDISKYNIPFPEDGVMAIFETLSSQNYGADLIGIDDLQYSKVPGIDMDLTKKDNYLSDLDNHNRKYPYSLVMETTDYATEETVRKEAFVYVDGDVFAISITIEK